MTKFTQKIFLFAFLGSALSLYAEGWQELSPAVEEIYYHVRAEIPRGKPLSIDVAQGDTLSFRRFEVVLSDTFDDDIFTKSSGKIFYKTFTDGKISVDTVISFDASTVNKNKKAVSIKLTGDVENALLETGCRSSDFATPVHLSGDVPIYIRYNLPSKGKVLRNICEYRPGRPVALSRFDTVESLYEYLSNSNDPYEGLWTFYDRTESPLRADAKSEYLLATVKSADGYQLVYLDDLTGTASSWRPLMIKAFMNFGGIQGVFDVDWFDRRGRALRSRVAAVLEGDILTFTFPYWETALRFNRISPSLLTPNPTNIYENHNNQ